MKHEYFIHTKNGMIPVKGYPCVIPGYKQFKFFYHRPIHSFSEGVPNFDYDSWSISEARTGFSVFPSSYDSAYSDKTRKGAFEIVLNRFESMGQKKIIARLKAAIKAMNAESETMKKRIYIKWFSSEGWKIWFSDKPVWRKVYFPSFISFQSAVEHAYPNHIVKVKG